MQALLAAPLFAAPAAATTAAAAGTAIAGPAVISSMAPAAAGAAGLTASSVAAPAAGGFLSSLTAGNVLQGGLGLLGAVSSIMGTSANAGLLEQQALMSEIQARSEEIRGLEEGNAILDAQNEADAASLARFSAAGIRTSEGAPQQVARGIERTGRRGLMFADTNAQIAAASRGFTARQLRSRAINTRRAGFTDALSGLAGVALS